MFPDFVQAFEHIPGGSVLFGAGVLEQIGDRAKAAGGTRALIVTDPGIAATGHVARTEDYLVSSGLSVAVFDQVRENPTTEDVDACVRVAREASVDLIVGLGGGSSMDTAKRCELSSYQRGTNAGLSGSGSRRETYASSHLLCQRPQGQGVECQSFALIADAESHAKMACGDKKAARRWLQFSIRNSR